MKPPICIICRKRFSNGGSLIYFKETEEDKEKNLRFKRKGFVGHPSNAVWFCKEHSKFAKQYSKLEKTEAIKLIKKELENLQIISIKRKK